MPTGLLAFGAVAVLLSCCVGVLLLSRSSSRTNSDPSTSKGGAEVVESDEARIEFVGASLSYTSYTDSLGRMQADNQALRIHILVAVSNLSKTKVIHYQGWMSVRSGVSLSDEHGNSYGLMDYGRHSTAQFDLDKKTWDQFHTHDIHPGKRITDVMVFMRPVDAASTLKLRLPKRNVGGSGSVELQFSTSKIRKFGPNKP
jgi:hypothetical protein